MVGMLRRPSMPEKQPDAHKKQQTGDVADCELSEKVLEDSKAMADEPQRVVVGWIKVRTAKEEIARKPAARCANRRRRGARNVPCPERPQAKP